MRARRIKDEEPKDRRDSAGNSEEVDTADSNEVWSDDSLLHSTLDRVRSREDLRSCSICLRQDIKPEEFRNHVYATHKNFINGTPKGYYGCWSGQEFWLPLKFATGPCKWLCTVCGSTKYYFGPDGTHGGPSVRLVDRRYGLANCEGARYGDKAGHKRAFGKIDGNAGPVIFMHEGAPNPNQPVQDDPSLASFIKEEDGARPKKKGKAAKADNSSKRNSRSAGLVRNRAKRTNG